MATPRVRLPSPAQLVSDQIDGKLEEIVTALGSRDGPTEECVTELNRLEYVAGLYAKRRVSDLRWSRALLFTILVGGILALYSCRIGTARITVDVYSTELAYTTVAAGILALPQPLKRMSATGVTSVELYAENGVDREVVKAEGLSLLRVSVSNPSEAHSHDGRPVAIYVDPVRVPPGAQVHLANNAQGPVTVRIVSLGAPIDIGWEGNAEISVIGDLPHWIELGSVRHLHLSVDEEVEIAFEPTESSSRVVIAESRISAFSVDRIESILTGPNPVIGEVSSIMEGTVRIDSTGGQVLKLRKGDHIHFRGVDGVLQQIEIDDRGLWFRFSGTVEGLTMGTSPHRRNVMPRMLTWLFAQEELRLIAGALLAGGGLITSILQRFWRRSS